MVPKTPAIYTAYNFLEWPNGPKGWSVFTPGTHRDDLSWGMKFSAINLWGIRIAQD